jgi:hypothetical protein
MSLLPVKSSLTALSSSENSIHLLTALPTTPPPREVSALPSTLVSSSSIRPVRTTKTCLSSQFLSTHPLLHSTWQNPPLCRKNCRMTIFWPSLHPILRRVGMNLGEQVPFSMRFCSVDRNKALQELGFREMFVCIGLDDCCFGLV